MINSKPLQQAPNVAIYGNLLALSRSAGYDKHCDAFLGIQLAA